MSNNTALKLSDKRGIAMKLISTIVVIILLLVTGVSAHAITPDKEKDIHTLLVLMGNSSMAEEMANSMVSISIAQEKKRYPNLPKSITKALWI